MPSAPAMPYGTIPGLRLPVSRIVLGAGDFSPDIRERAFDLLDAFVARGGTMIDTAPMYRDGGSERVIGEWLRRRARRDDVLIATKAGYWYVNQPTRLTPEEIAFDLGQSLQHLGTTHVDLLLLHLDDPTQRVEPLVDALNRHAALGRVHDFGGSNWTHHRIEEANTYAAAHNLTPFAAGSPNLALAVPQEPMWPRTLSIAGNQEALDWYRQTSFPLIAWSAQANGFFSGCDTPDVRRVYASETNRERLRRAQRLAAELGVTPTQIALAWLLNQPGLNVFAVIGPRTVEELESSLAAADVTLTPDQVAWLSTPWRRW